MKENTKIIIGVIIGIVISSTISITATTMIQADKVNYKTSNGDTTDVNSALDRLFDLNTVNEKIGSTDISSIGDGTITGAVDSLNLKSVPVKLLYVTPTTSTDGQTFNLSDSIYNYSKIVMQVYYTYYCIAEFSYEPKYFLSVYNYDTFSAAGHIRWSYMPLGTAVWSGFAEFNTATTLYFKHDTTPPDGGISIRIIGYK